jgi:mono/diheme cytochrome c family protein
LNDPNTQTYSDDKLRQILLNGVSGTLMAPWDDRLEDDDIDSLIALMVNWDQVPSGAIPAPERPVAVTEESLVMGSELYASNCARCHGPEGQGTQRAPALNVKGFLTEVSDAAIQQIIALGVPGTSMPAWGDRIAEADIQAIVGYIRAWEPTAPEVAEPARGGGGPWWQSSGGTSRGGGAGGGPPWMRNDNPTTQGNATMPSSGAIVEVQFDPHQPGDESTSSHQSAQRPEQGQGDPPIGASSQEHLPGENGGPPWSREESPESWWENLDWRAYTLFGAGMGLSILIILTAVVGLYRLDRSSV